MKSNFLELDPFYYRVKRLAVSSSFFFFFFLFFNLCIAFIWLRLKFEHLVLLVMAESKTEEFGFEIPEPVQFDRAVGFLESVFRQVFVFFFLSLFLFISFLSILTCGVLILV